MNEHINDIKTKIEKSLYIVNEFKWLIDSSVLDFFQDNHWERLPQSWKQSFNNINPEKLTQLFPTISNKNVDEITDVWPLSILCLRILNKDLCINRSPAITNSNDDIIKYKKFDLSTLHISEQPILCFNHTKLKNLFTKQIKLKKQHEIQRMAFLCATSARKQNIDYIIDFGSGLGHLARLLSYGYGLKVCGIEQQVALTEQAANLDENMEKMINKYLKEKDNQFTRPRYLHLKLTKETKPEKFIQTIIKTLCIENTQKSNIKFGIIGLHACGDLTAFLMKIFADCKQAKLLCIVGCCYEKLSSNTIRSHKDGYPFSRYLKNCTHNWFLSYKAKEIACHAQEIYCKRLKCNDYTYLKIHCYRATFEKIICRYWPHLRNSGLKSIKYTENLSFGNYCLCAVHEFPIKIPEEYILSEETENMLSKWKNVIVFYTLRLMIANLIESILINDRYLFILEHGFLVNLNAVFDAEVSPRNIVLTAMKGENK